jgi:hypothetical protein
MLLLIIKDFLFKAQILVDNFVGHDLVLSELKIIRIKKFIISYLQFTKFRIVFFEFILCASEFIFELLDVDIYLVICGLKLLV